MNSEDIMLSEISQTHKDKYCMIPLIWNRVVSVIEKESRMVVARGWWEGYWGVSV